MISCSGEVLCSDGIFMKYSYEYKKQCVELYRQGKWPETPVGEKQKNFHKTIREWARMEEACGPEVLHHKSQNKVWTVEEKYELVAKVFDTFIFHRIVLI